MRRYWFPVATNQELAQNPVKSVRLLGEQLTLFKDRQGRLGLIDEASMLDDRQFDDLKEIFPTLLLFGDPAQLAPVGQSGQMVFERLAAPLPRTHQRPPAGFGL